MAKIINLIVAVLVFFAIYGWLCPLLPEPFRTPIQVIVVVAAIIFLLYAVSDFEFWPWRK